MKKHKLETTARLALNKETIAALVPPRLTQVVGGNLTTVKSQCPTMCFTLD